MSSRNQPSPGIVGKDALRGIRYALKRGAKMVADHGPRQLPEQIESASSDILDSAEKLTRTIDQITTRILGLQFDEATFRPPSFATTRLSPATDEQISNDASNLYFALTHAACQLEISDLLVSEFLCSKLIAEDVSVDVPAPERETALLCCELFEHILSSRILGAPPGIASQHNAERADDIAVVAFATSLWAYVERGAFEETEMELLGICADVARQKSSEIAAARTDTQSLKSLFSYALSTV